MTASLFGISACGLVLGIPSDGDVVKVPSLDGAAPLDGSDSGPGVDAGKDALGGDTGLDGTAPDGSCTADLTSDPANCGACGHDCLGGGCTASKCQPVAIVDSNTYGPNAVAVDSTYVYFADASQGGVFRVHKDPKQGSAVEVVAKPGGYFQVWRVATDGTNVFFTDTGNVTTEGDVWQCPATGCGSTNQLRKKLYGGVNTWPYDVLIVGSSLFFTTELDAIGSVRKCSIPDCAGGPITIASNQDSPEILASDENGTSVFWSVYNSGAVRSCPAASTGACSPTDVITAEPSLYGVAARNGTVYAAKLSGSSGKIVSKKATQATFASGQVWSFQVVADAQNVYWTNRTDNPSDSNAGVNGSLMTCPVTGCAPSPVKLAQVAGGLRGIAQDATAVYYTEFANGKVWKLAK